LNNLFNQTFRMVSRMLGWLFEKGWTEPVSIKAVPVSRLTRPGSYQPCWGKENQ